MTGKKALVTGGGRGIGKAVAVALAKQGAEIALIYGSDSASAQKTADEIISNGGICRIYGCDVSDFTQSKKIIDQILSDFGKIDILINNAGITKDNLILTMGEEDFDKVIGVNLKGAFNIIKHLYRNFMKNRYGRIINITSIAGIDGNAGQANYSAAKAGLIGLTKTVAKELAARNVTCNAVAPGMIETNMTKVLSDNLKAAAAERIPLKRMGTPEEVAALTVFLASGSASYITGQVIRADGGLTI